MERLSGIYQYPSTDDVTGIKCGVGRTKQSFASECDINKIVARAHKTGMPYTTGHQGVRQAKFGDFTNANDYFTMRTKVDEAERAFLALPVELRAKCGHSVGGFIEWLDNPANKAEAIKLKLIPDDYFPPPVLPKTETVAPKADAPKGDASNASAQ